MNFLIGESTLHREYIVHHNRVNKKFRANGSGWSKWRLASRPLSMVMQPERNIYAGRNTPVTKLRMATGFQAQMVRVNKNKSYENLKRAVCLLHCVILILVLPNYNNIYEQNIHLRKLYEKTNYNKL